MTDVIPLVPCLVLRQIQDDSRDLKQYTNDEISTFSPQNLRPDPLIIYTETLNIVGKRMAGLMMPRSLNTIEGSQRPCTATRVDAVRSISAKRLEH